MITFRKPLFVCLLALSIAGCGRSTVDDHVRKAEQYLHQSHVPEAILEFRLALQKDPERGDVRLRLGDAYSSVGDTGNAQREYLLAADKLPDDLASQLRAGNILLRAGRFSDAKSRADAILARDAKNVDAQILRGNALAGLKDIDGAIREYQAAIAVNPDKEGAYLNIAAIQTRQGAPAEAEAAFRKAVEVAPKSVGARMALANFLWTSGHPAEAERQLKDAQSLEPSNVAANRALGTFYVATGRPKDAETYFKNIAHTAETTADHLSLADYYIAVGRRDEARALLRDLAKRPDGDAPATLRLASLDAAEDKRGAAIESLRRVLDTHTNDMSIRLLLARVLLLDGKRDDALAMATSIVTDDPMAPESADAYLLVGSIQAALGQTDEAIKSYEEILKRDARPFVADLSLASLYLKKGAFDKAVAYADQARSMQPSNAQARSVVIRVLLGKGDFVRARAELESLRREFPNSPAVLDLQAAVQMKDRQVDGARAAYLKAVDRAPGDLEALAGLINIDLKAGKTRDAVDRVAAALRRGQPSPTLLTLAAKTYSAAGDFTTAEGLLRRAIDADPKRFQAYSLLGTLYFKQRKLDGAHEQFQQMLKLNPRSVSANTMLAILLEAQGKASEAEKQYQKVLLIDSEAAVASNNLAWMYVSGNRNLDQALRLAQSAKIQLPDEPHVNDTLGWVYYRKGLAASAIPHLELSVDKDPADPMTHYHLGMAYLQTKKTQEARHELQRALEFKVPFLGEEEARKALSSVGGH